MDRSLGSIVKSALIAGLVAALIVAVYHFFVTEPVLQHAIDFEAANAAAEEHATGGGHEEEKELVSRPAQRVGLFVGFAMYGIAWSLITAALYFPAQRWLPHSTVAGKVIILALLLYASVSLMPFLKYPANPPAVGDPNTIERRQELYVGIIVLSVAGTLAAMALGELAARGRLSSLLTGRRWPVVAVTMVAFGAILYFAMPPFTDPITIPRDILNGFRWRSLIGLTFFWALFGAGFAWLLARPVGESVVRRPSLDTV